MEEKRSGVQEALDKLYEDTKDLEERRKVALVYNNDVDMKLLTCWSLVARETVMDDPSLDLWQQFVFSYDEWCSLAGVPPSDKNMSRCERFIKLGLVLPDGRLHYWVELYIDRETGILVPNAQRPEQPSESSPEDKS
jgi:hypothetical protein